MKPIRSSTKGTYTPGPWRAKLDQFDFTNGGERYVVYGDPETDHYGTVALVRPRLERKERGKNATPYNAPDAERDANALLLAAAPELLDALRAIVNHGEPIYPSDWQRLKTNGLDAIRKATNGI